MDLLTDLSLRKRFCDTLSYTRWVVTFGSLCIDSIVQQARGGRRVLPSGCRTDLTGHAFTQGSVALTQTSIVLKSFPD